MRWVAIVCAWLLGCSSSDALPTIPLQVMLDAAADPAAEVKSDEPETRAEAGAEAEPEAGGDVHIEDATTEDAAAEPEPCRLEGMACGPGCCAPMVCVGGVCAVVDAAADAPACSGGCQVTEYKWIEFWTLPPAGDAGTITNTPITCPAGAAPIDNLIAWSTVACTCDDGATVSSLSKDQGGWTCCTDTWTELGKPSGGECMFMIWCKGPWCVSTQQPCE